MNLWLRLTSLKKGAERLSFAINMTEEEVEHVKTLREGRDKAIKLSENYKEL